MGRHRRESQPTPQESIPEEPVARTQEMPRFIPTLPVNERPGYVPEETGFDHGLETVRRWGTRGVVLTAVGSLGLLAALYWDMQRSQPFVPFATNPKPRAAAPISPTPTLAPSPTELITPSPVIETPSPSPTKVAVKKARPSPSPAHSSASPSASATETESPSPSPSSSPEYECNPGPNLVVCEPTEDEAMMSTYKYPDTRRQVVYVLSPGQKFDAECQLISPTQGGQWILGTDGTYAQQALFGGDVSGVPQCDMN